LAWFLGCRFLDTAFLDLNGNRLGFIGLALEIELTSTDTQSSGLFWSKKIDNEKQQISEFKKNYFFTSFLIDHSEKIPELDIITSLIENKQCNLDELKNTIDLPPILAIRTIKQMAIKQIIDLDEDNNIVSLSKSALSI